MSTMADNAVIGERIEEREDDTGWEARRQFVYRKAGQSTVY